MVDAVIFDWGGTITPYHQIDYRATWREIALALDPVRVEELTDALLDADQALWLRARDESRSGHMAEVCAAAGVPFDDAYQAAFVAAWEPHTYTDGDADALLRGLRERGIGVGLLSNTTWPARWHDDFLARDGVLDLFDARVYTSDLGYVKPHRAAFEAALESVGVTDPGAAVYVGDRAYDDIHGAGQVGMRTVFVPHSELPETERWGTPGKADATVDRLSDLLPIVDRWHTAP